MASHVLIDGETFRCYHWSLRVASSRGFSLVLRTHSLAYRDKGDSIVIRGETVLDGGEVHFSATAKDIPDSVERPRDRMIDDLRRAFMAVGWHLDIGGRLC